MTANSVFVLYFLVCTAMISATYCSIRYHSVMDPLFVLTVVLGAFFIVVMLGFLITKAINMRLESEKACERFQEMHRSSIAETLFWKSCRPVKIKFGVVGSIETYDFLKITFESVILKVTIDLLLNF